MKFFDAVVEIRVEGRVVASQKVAIPGIPEGTQLSDETVTGFVRQAVVKAGGAMQVPDQAGLREKLRYPIKADVRKEEKTDG